MLPLGQARPYALHFPLMVTISLPLEEGGAGLKIKSGYRGMGRREKERGNT